MNNIFRFFKNPPMWLILLTYALTVVFAALSVTSLVTGYEGVIVYAVYALAAITLSYSIYTLVKFSPSIKKKVKELIYKNGFTEKYVTNFGFRAFVGAVISLAFNIGFSVFNGVLGIMSHSVWYGSLSLYYILLSLIYGSIVLNGRETNLEKSYKIYRRCGILLTLLNSALSIAIGQMIFEGQGFQYGGLMIYVCAAYAFYKITMAIIQLFALKKQKSPITHATVFINFTGGMVSILALQTALLSTFGNGTDNSLFNTLTGSFVSLTTLTICIYMIINGTKKLKSEKNK